MLNQCQRLSLAALAFLLSCADSTVELPEATRIEVIDANAGVARSADGMFEVEFQLGALGQTSEITIRTDRTQETSPWRLSPTLPRYEVMVSPCSILRPELIEVRHRVPEDLSWEGKLTLAKSSAAAPELSSRAQLRDAWVVVREFLDCAPEASQLGSSRFELATQTNGQCSSGVAGVCLPCQPCEVLDPECSRSSDWLCEQDVCRPLAEIEEGSCAEIGISGWDDPPGSGPAFILDSFGFAEAGRGFDVDGACRGPGDCIENSLSFLGGMINDQIRQSLLGGETLLLMELAGLDESYTGDARGLTLKHYRARDADDPFFPANNFQVPRGESDCCRFEIHWISLQPSPPQARLRALAAASRGRLQTVYTSSFEIDFYLGAPSYFRVDRAQISAKLPTDLSRISEGTLGGAMSIRTLAQISNIYCLVGGTSCPRQLPQDSTLLDLVASFAQPDIDLDESRDGLERLEVGANGRIARCIDGDGLEVLPIDPNDPAWMCALNPKMADGFSVAFNFTAVRATIVGFAD